MFQSYISLPVMNFLGQRSWNNSSSIVVSTDAVQQVSLPSSFTICFVFLRLTKKVYLMPTTDYKYMCWFFLLVSFRSARPSFDLT